MFRSIRWKFITIYFILVFIAMIIIGVFIIQQFEDYNLRLVSDRLYRIANQFILPDINKLPPNINLDDNKEELQNVINRWANSFYREEIFIIDDDFEILASNNSYLTGENAIYELEDELIIEGLKGNIIERDKKIPDNETKNIVFPIVRNNEVQGLLYIRDKIDDIYDTLDESKGILTEATLLALIITVVLGYFIAKSVTEPINNLTDIASKMAKGDFQQKVEVKSDDEIGKLGEMFNYLTKKLNLTLGEISSEKSKMETILNYMADGLIAVNLEGRIIHINPKAIDMLKLDNEEELENKLYDNIFINLNPKLSLDFIINNSRDWVGSEIIEMENTILNVNYAPFRNDEKQKGGLVLVIQDITEQQKLENMRREFVANVSHELKTPLTSIKSYTETLLSGMLENKGITERFLNVINSEADRMTRLVRDLLQLSNIDFSQTQWKKEKHDLVKLIKQVIIKLEITAENKKQRLTLHTRDEQLYGKFDYDRIEQVLLNIITNSIKYTPEEGEIDVTLEKKDDMGVITVRDTGIGIPKEDLPRIFERFYRVDKARSRELGGTGLGLSIANEIIKAHGGTIEINSEVEKGTEVIISLPLEEKIV